MTGETSGSWTTRRTFLGGAASLTATAVLPRGAFGDAGGLPDSVFHGVRIGCITYNIPPGSDAVKEVAKCVQYCKDALA